MSLVITDAGKCQTLNMDNNAQCQEITLDSLTSLIYTTFLNLLKSCKKGTTVLLKRSTDFIYCPKKRTPYFLARACSIIKLAAEQGKTIGFLPVCFELISFMK